MTWLRSLALLAVALVTLTQSTPIAQPSLGNAQRVLQDDKNERGLEDYTSVVYLKSKIKDTARAGKCLFYNQREWTRGSLSNDAKKYVCARGKCREKLRSIWVSRSQLRVLSSNTREQENKDVPCRILTTPGSGPMAI